MTLTEFLAARLDADEADIGPSLSTTYYCEEQNGVHLTRDRALREVEAKRKILAWWQRGDPGSDDPAPSPTYENYRESLPGYQLLLALAAIWDAHPDFDPAWVPDR